MSDCAMFSDWNTKGGWREKQYLCELCACYPELHPGEYLKLRKSASEL
jgi:hypothetical protein